MTNPPGGGWANPSWGEPADGPGGAAAGGSPGTSGPAGPAYGPYARAPEPGPLVGAVPLRPLGIGEMLDGALSIIRRHPRITIGLAAVIVTVEQAVSVLAQVSTGSVGGSLLPGSTVTNLTNPVDSAVGLGLQLVNLIISTVLGAILTGMLIIVVGESVIGRPVDLAQIWRRVRPRFWALLGGSLLAGLLPWLAAALAAGVGVVLGLLVNTVTGVLIGSLLVVAALIFPGAYLWGKLALTTPAITLEQLGPLAGMRRSWQLVRSDFFRVWGTRALSSLIGSFLTAIIATPFLVVGAIVLSTGGNGGDPSGWRQAIFLVLTSIGGIVAGSVVQPYLSGVIGLLYVDRRMRGEGLDIALQESTRAARHPLSVPSGWA